MFNGEGKSEAMESYIVRIYRVDQRNPRSLVGLVEEVGAEEQRAFRNVEELWAILNPSKKTKIMRSRREQPQIEISSEAPDSASRGK